MYYYLYICNISIYIKIPFFRVSVTIESGRSILLIVLITLMYYSGIPYKDKTFANAVVPT